MRSRGTHAWTTAEMKNPKTSAHHTSQPISKASRSPCQSDVENRSHPTTIPLGGIW